MYIAILMLGCICIITDYTVLIIELNPAYERSSSILFKQHFIVKPFDLFLAF